MNLIAIGVNHNTAPIELREKISLPDSMARNLLTELIDSKLATEALVLSTCNRTELYVVPSMPEVTANYLKDYIIAHKGVRKEVTRDHFFNYFACGAVRHFYNVACAIDSLILGEVQIIGQVKNAYNRAVEMKTVGPILNKMCHTGFSVANRVRSKTKLTAGAVSVSYAAVELTQKIYSDVSTKNILLVGAGDTAKLAAKNLLDKRVRDFYITNRTYAKAELLAQELGTGKILPLEEMTDRLHEFDIVVTAVGGNDHIIKKEHVAAAMQKRHRDPILILDLGLPRNVAPDVGEVNNVFLKDIDDLKMIIDSNLEKRRAEVPKVKHFIQKELIEYARWYFSLEVKPTIVDLQEKFFEIKSLELARIKNKVSAEEYERMEQLSDRIIKKLLHFPITTLKQQSADTTDPVSFIRNIFDLKEQEEEFPGLTFPINLKEQNNN